MYLGISGRSRHIISIADVTESYRRIMSSLAKCRLVCPSGSHPPIELPHKEPVTIGRSVQTKIADKKVSRQQVSLVADCRARSVTVTQLGGNPCQVGETELKKGASTTLRGDTLLYLVAGSYPNRAQFEGGASPGGGNDKAPKRSIGDFFGKKSTDNSKAKRPAEDAGSEGQRKRQRTEDGACGDQNEETEEVDEEEEERLRLVQERLAKMKKTYDKEPVPTGTEKNGEAKKAVPEAQGAPTSAPKWEKHEKLIIHTGAGVRATHKVAAFDIDGCIICTKSGKVFAQNAADWKIQFPEIKKKLKRLLSDGFKVVFFTNQMGIARGKVKEADFKQKVEGIVSELNLPIQVFIASGPGVYRKPGLGMWNFLVHHRNDGIEVDVDQSFYVGDAAGRPEKWAPGKKKDFAMSDRLFALNAGLVFHTPEEFFLGYKKAPFNMPDFDPRAISKDTSLFASDATKLTSGDQEVIVNVGLPGSGKSHFTRTHLLPKGYVHVNRDTLGTWQKCVEATRRALKEGRSVVVDNTNVDLDSRKRYVDVAKAAKVTCRCFWFDVSPKHCRHNERFREMTDKSHQAINDMIFNQHKSKFKTPERSEGFTEVAKVKFVPTFKDLTEEKLYRQFLLEK